MRAWLLGCLRAAHAGVVRVLGLPPWLVSGRGTSDAGEARSGFPVGDVTSHPSARARLLAIASGTPGTGEKATTGAELGTANRLRYRRALEVREQDRSRVLRVHERADLIAATAPLDDHGFEPVPHHSPSLRIRPIHA